MVIVADVYAQGSGDGLDGEIVGRDIPIRARLAEGADRAIHDPGISRGDFGGAETEPSRRRRVGTLRS